MSGLEFDSSTNVASLGGESLVFHCHYYNCALQEALESGLGDEAGQVQSSAAERAVRAQLSELCRGKTAVETLETGASLFSRLGFGLIHLADIGPEGGTVVCAHSHYAMGWLATRGERSTPVCHFVAGFVAAAFGVAHDRPADRVRVTETSCFATGAERCLLKVEVL